MFVRAVLVASLLAGPAGAVDFEWTTVGYPWNPGDSRASVCCFGLGGQNGLGAVTYVFRMTVHEITNAQYAEFLNAVASGSDPYGLWNPGMGRQDLFGDPGGIVRAAIPGAGWFYFAVPDLRENPVRWMDFYRAARFVNWLHNGQTDDPASTESGAYALLGGHPSGVVRESTARFRLPTEDEWYKAAYYDPLRRSYDSYPTASHDPPLAEPPPGGPASANNAFGVLDPVNGFCYGPDCWLVPVGSYPETRSSFQVEDMAGGTMELTETNVPQSCPGCRAVKGGEYRKDAGDAHHAFRNRYPERCDGCWGLGFRVVAPGGPPRRCGLGWELAPVLAALAARPVRRRRVG